MANENPGTAEFWRYNAQGPTPLLTVRPKVGTPSVGTAEYWRYNAAGEFPLLDLADAVPSSGSTLLLMGVG